MRPALATIAAAALLASAPAASADTLLEEFKALCDTSLAEPGRALAWADRDGWQPLPAAMRSQLSDLGFKSGEGRIRVKDRIRTVLFVGAGEGEVGGRRMQGRLCALGQLPGGSSTLAAAAAAWAQVPPDPSHGVENATGYAFADTGGTHRAVDFTDEDRVDAMVQGGVLRGFLVSATNRLDYLLIAIPQP